MKRRLSKRAISIGLVAGLLFLAGTTAQAGWLFVIAACVLGVVGGSLFVRHHLARLEVVRVTPRRARVGDDVAVRLSISNPGRFRSPLVRLEDHFPAYEMPSVVVESLGSNESAEVELVRGLDATRCSPHGFGEAHIGIPLRVHTVDADRRGPHRHDRGPSMGRASLLPDPGALLLAVRRAPRESADGGGRAIPGRARVPARRSAPGGSLAVDGRAGKLIVREFEEEVASKVVLVIAGDDVGVPPDSAYEMLVGAAASIGIYALMTGHPIEMARPDTDGSPLRASDPDRFAILDWLAAAKPLDAELTPLAAAAIGGMGRRGTVVLLTTGNGAATASVPDAVRDDPIRRVPRDRDRHRSGRMARGPDLHRAAAESRRRPLPGKGSDAGR